jgi:ATP-dependent helicase/DNAse subunit B
MVEKTEKLKDKYKAVWLSHSSIADFLKCPRLYYLRNVYKDSRTGRKINVMNPHLALGQAVHEIVESLSILPVEERLGIPPIKKFDLAWRKVEGEKGGFVNHEQEIRFKERGIRMLKNLQDNPGPILNKAVKIKSESGLPYYWFSEEENIILCGKIDWIEYLEGKDSIHIIDFKTGKHEEDDSSLQLPIYFLLATNTQKRRVIKVSYWYLDKEDGLIEKKLPKQDEAREKVDKIASRIKLARQINHFKCKTNGCRFCLPFERVLRGDGKWVGVSDYRQDIYVLNC